jgi:hypothetical protein
MYVDSETCAEKRVPSVSFPYSRLQSGNIQNRYNMAEVLSGDFAVVSSKNYIENSNRHRSCRIKILSYSSAG